MKKILFWVTFPITMPIALSFAFLGTLAMFVMAAVEKWEDYCFPGGMKHTPSKKEMEERARMRRNIHKNGNPP